MLVVVVDDVTLVMNNSSVPTLSTAFWLFSVAMRGDESTETLPWVSRKLSRAAKFAVWKARPIKPLPRDVATTEPNCPGETVEVLVAPMALAAPVFAGDAAKGEADFKKCKACHMIVADDGTVIQKDMQTPDGKERLAAEGSTPGGITPEEFAVHIKREITKWAKVVKASGAKAD